MIPDRKPPTGTPTPIQYPQLCAVAREQLLADPTMPDSEWNACIRDRLVLLGFAYPRPDQLAAAMSSVQYALGRTLGPRPVRTAALAPAAARSAPTPREWQVITGTVRRLLAPVATAVDPDAAPAPRETLAVTEAELLDRFYRAAPQDRLGTVKAFAELALLRDATWNPAEIRQAHEARHGSMVGQHCFGCLSGERPLAWHHVIQIQHGGSNAARNRIPLCQPCHAAVHPWLPPMARTAPSGWTRLGDIGS